MVMKKLTIIVAGCLVFCLSERAQGKFYTKSGKISFFSSTSVENIAAINKSAVTLLDTKTGELQFAVLMKGFEFKKALMQEHFNRTMWKVISFPKRNLKDRSVITAK